MKKFENLSDLQEYFKIVFKYKGHIFADVEHSVARFYERVPNTNINVYKNLIEKGIDYLYSEQLQNTEDRYIFRSKKHGFGVQVHWRPDRKDPRIFGGYSATTLSTDEMKFFKNNDVSVFLENMKNNGITLQESESIIEKGYYRFSFNEETQKEMDICNFDSFIESGEIFHTFEMIEI